MTVERLNKNNFLDELDQEWPKILMILMHKYAPGQSVVITATDIDAFAESREEPCLIANASGPDITFSIMERSDAEEMARNYNPGTDTLQ